MLCCAVLVFVLGLAREAWFLVPGVTRPAEPGFAPVARRPFPETLAPAPMAPAPIAPAPAAASPGRLATALLLAALATVAYAVAVYLLLLLGFARAHTASAYIWLLRDVVLGVVALSAAVIAARRRRPDRTVPARQVQGSALAGFGAAWFLLGVADMHAFSLFQLAGGSTLADLVFHGSGAALVLAGALLLSSREPRRSTGAGHPTRERMLHGH